MDNKEEYHDPDYPEAPVCVKEEPPAESEEENVEKIKEIIRREFSNELEIRENEVMLIDQRMTTSRRLLHRLRYAIVSSYYNDLKLQMTNGQIHDEIAAQRDPRAKAEISTLLREGQRDIHPSVRKLLGKKTVDLAEIFKTRAPRNKVRKDYSAMLQKRNYTIPADATKTLRPDKKAEEEPEASSSQPKKIPRHMEPKITNVVTLAEITRNQMKHRYRIVIGNTSKYAPAASAADRSTHKWLLYVRGPPRAPDLAPLVTAVTVRLHHSYAPHHTVHLHKPPFHITRRGWGEFPARVELHFTLPQRNRPALVHHTIKLDTDLTGVQTLGAETLVDVWLYSTPEMLKYEYKEESETILQSDAATDTQAQEGTHAIVEEIQPKTEPPERESFDDSCDGQSYNQADDWLNFFSKEPKELDVDEMIIKPVKKIEEKNDLENLLDGNISKCAEECIVKEEPAWSQTYEDTTNEEVPKEILNQPALPKKRIVKYIEPTTGKIYYLEMDRNLDLSKVQEIVINNTTAKISPIKGNGMRNPKKRKTGVSLLKPEVKSLLKSENAVKNEIRNSNLAHIENDHCYLATPMRESESVANVEVKKEKSLYEYLCSMVYRFQCIRAAVNFLLKRIPLISDQARDPDFLKYFPFVVDSYDRYWKMDFAKRRNIEWSRAKLINRILSEHHTQADIVWRTKQILVYSRLHGYHPIRNECLSQRTDTNDWSSWNEVVNIRQSETRIKQLYPNASDITTLSVFRPEDYEMSELLSVSDSDDEVDVVGCRSPPRVKKEAPREEGQAVLPVEDENDRLRFLYVEKKCADIGVDLRCEDVGNGYFYSAVHAVLVSAMKCFAEEVLRSALAAKLAHDASEHAVPAIWAGSSSSRTVVSLEHVYDALHNPRLHSLAAKDLGTTKKNTYSV